MAMPLRLCAMALGLICSVLGCFGAFEFAHKLEGGVTYLVLAAPMIAAAAALIPIIAEETWRDGKFLKSLLWWLVLVPAGATVFFAAAERVHVAKAGAEAERAALRGAATRAEAALTVAEGRLVSAQAAANKARGQKQCGPDCRAKLAAETSAKADVSAAKQEALATASKATMDSPLKAPVWLLPAALDLVAFMAMWTAFSGFRAKPARKAPAKPAAKGKPRKAKRSSKPRAPKADPKAEAEGYFRRAVGDGNVVRFPTT